MANVHRWLLAVSLSVLLVITVAGPGLAAVSAKVSAKQIRDYTRISFGWPKQMRFKVNSSGNNVTLSFDQAAQIDFTALRNTFGKRLIGASMSPDGKRVQLSFDQSYRVRHFISGNTNGIDVIGTNKPLNTSPPPAPPPPKAAPPKPTPPAAKPVARPAPPKAPPLPSAAVPRSKPKPPSKPVDVAQAETPPPEAAPTPAPAPAPTPAPAAQPKPTQEPKPLMAPTPSVAPAPAPEPEPTPPPAPAPTPQAAPVPTPEPSPQVTVTPEAVPVAPDSPVMDAADSEFVADEEPAQAEDTPADDGVQTLADQIQEDAPAEDVAAEAEEDAAPNMDSFVADEDAPAEEETGEVATDSFVADEEEDAPAEGMVAAAEAETDAEAEPAPTAAAEEVDASEFLAEGEPVVAEPTQEEAAPPVAEVVVEENAEDVDAIAPETAAPVPPKPKLADQPPTVVQDAAAADNGEPFLVTAKTLPNGVEIQFPWSQRTGTAVFRRYDAIWVVFDRERRINVDMLKGILPASIKDIQQIVSPGHTVLHITTDGSMFPQVTKNRYSTEWRILLSPYRKIPSQPVPIELRPDSAVPNISLDVLEYADPVTVTDPVIGDEVIVTPFFRSGQGIFPTREYVDVILLETSQGMAAVKKNDFVTVRALRSGLRVTSSDGLVLSRGLPQLSITELEALEGKFDTLLPYDQWKIEPGTFVKVRQELEAMQAGASATRITGIRHKLAGLYLGQGMAHEALSLLDMIRQDDVGYYYQNKLAAMRGAANFLMNRYAAAIADFSSKEVVSEEEIKVWEDALAIFQKDRPRFNFLEYYESYIGKYPPRIQERLAILAADNYINRRSFQKALNSFDTLSRVGISDETMPYINFLIGKISAENGNAQGAKFSWEPLVKESDDRFIRARAQFALTTLLYNEGEIDIDEAIQRLDNLRIIWRGDTFELSLLNFLGQLYIDNDNYLEGLRVWRELVVNYPDSGLAIGVAREMARTFNLLFAEGLADDMEPLQALALFYEFRELTPIGEAGDKMIQNLASRLAKVDLLYRAAALLEHQIKYRQEGIARSKLGAQLALIYILNEEPGKAVNALELTGYGQNPRELQHKRFQLSALAMAELGEYERAVEILRPDSSEAADDLRLNIYWRMNDWPNVVDTVERMLAQREDITAPLTEIEANQLLQLAIAYIFQSKQDQLLYLRNAFLPLMANTQTKEIFSFITEAASPIDPEKFDEVAGQIKVFEDFMDNYKKKLTNEGLNAAVRDMDFF
ncbi:MAG: hypothetical protein MRY32_02000 [Rickettsiales bacterium]|nr:hypothetical protein [Rickettsiales bacterium]